MSSSLAVDVYNSIIAIKALYNYNYHHYQVDRLTMSSMLVSSTSHVGGGEYEGISALHWP